MTWGQNTHGQLGMGVEHASHCSSSSSPPPSSPEKPPQILSYFVENNLKPIMISCGAAHTSSISIKNGSERSETSLHTWGIRKACDSQKNIEVKDFSTPQRVNKHGELSGRIMVKHESIVGEQLRY